MGLFSFFLSDWILVKKKILIIWQRANCNHLQMTSLLSNLLSFVIEELVQTIFPLIPFWENNLNIIVSSLFLLFQFSHFLAPPTNQTLIPILTSLAKHASEWFVCFFHFVWFFSILILFSGPSNTVAQGLMRDCVTHLQHHFQDIDVDNLESSQQGYMLLTQFQSFIHERHYKKAVS